VSTTPRQHVQTRAAAHHKQVVRTTGQSPANARAQKVANCSEFATCGGSTAKPRTGEGQSAKGSKPHSGSSRATSEAYMKRVLQMRMKGIIEMLAPGKDNGCNNGVNCWDP